MMAQNKMKRLHARACPYCGQLIKKKMFWEIREPDEHKICKNKLCGKEFMVVTKFKTTVVERNEYCEIILPYKIAEYTKKI